MKILLPLYVCIVLVLATQSEESFSVGVYNPDKRLYIFLHYAMLNYFLQRITTTDIEI